jgi:hypothetical protein
VRALVRSSNFNPPVEIDVRAAVQKLGATSATLATFLATLNPDKTRKPQASYIHPQNVQMQSMLGQ